MWGILISAAGWLLNYFLGGAAIRWAVLALLWGGVAILLNMLLSYIPAFVDGSSLSSGTSSFTPGIWYFMDYFKVEFGISTALSAAVARFIVRRIPIIG